MNNERTIKTNLTLSFIIYIIMFFIFLALLSNILIERQFVEYSKEKQMIKIDHIKNSIEQQYTDGTFNADIIKLIGENAFDDGFIIAVYNQDDEMVWDANYHHGQKCDMMINALIQRMQDYDASYKGEIIIQKTKLQQNETVIGELSVRHLSPYFYDESEFSFLTTLNRLYIVSVIVFILLAIIIASLIARKLSRPLETVTRELREIEKGNYKNVSFNKTNTREINELTGMINSLKQTLTNQENLRKQLTSDISHELRTPLSTLQATLEAMIDRVIEPNQEMFLNLHEELERLTKIVSDLDRLHEYEEHVKVLEKESVNIAHLVKNVVDMFDVKFEQKKITVVSRLDQVHVMVDKDKLSQVMVNILSNSLKYTKDHGHIQITVTNQGEYGEIEVSDDGIGIDSTELPFVFERLYRTDKSRARETGGYGIGLSIVKSIIDAHAGTITIDSAPNKGTKVTIKLEKE